MSTALGAFYCDADCECQTEQHMLLVVSDEAIDDSYMVTPPQHHQDSDTAIMLSDKICGKMLLNTSTHIINENIGDCRARGNILLVTLSLLLDYNIINYYRY